MLKLTSTMLHFLIMLLTLPWWSGYTDKYSSVVESGYVTGTGHYATPPDPTPERRCLYEEMDGDTSEGLRILHKHIPSQQPPIILPLHMENIPLSQPIQCPAKSQNTALMRVKSMPTCGSPTSPSKLEKPQCKPYNTRAMTIDTSNILMVPFHFSFAVVWDPGGLSKMIGKCLWHHQDWAEGVLSYFPYLCTTPVPSLCFVCFSMASPRSHG